MHKVKILLVEDELTLGQIIKDTLETQSFSICYCENGVAAWNMFKSFAPDICVVDIMMPRKDGLSLVEDIRTVNETIPIIFLSAKSQTADVIAGLKTGADDYMKKPFSMEELILRIKALLKRTQHVVIEIEKAKQEEFKIGNFVLYFNKNTLVHKTSIIKLSQRESELLKLLIESEKEILTRKEVLLKLWGDDNFFNARTMDVYISKLRKHLAKDNAVEIINVRGVGFKLIIHFNY